MLNPALSVDITLPGFPLRLPLPPDPLPHSFLRLGPHEHTRVRRMVMPEFDNAAVDAYRPLVRELVQGLLDELEAKPPPVDLLLAFAFPIPALMIARILGMPERDLDAFQEQSLALTLSLENSCERAVRDGALTDNEARRGS
ncbi:hypothetical protein [Streptomyces sp. SID3343]|uniref:hypothetical protein n=1 Tax=Streptomyces sp. SID3343 TaxID=2690260 RepID=UPI001369DDDB|nr:hypothetical protein [Streptomyces sp. SID3343]MYV99180.1 hypothetical protein [Streptomyces sp. SID3343]